jgi:hypothetical protein
MISGQRPDTIDTQIVFRIYAVLALLAGSVIVGWSPSWMGTPALMRVFGAVLAASGCWAYAISEVEDPMLRRRGFRWFAAAHFIVLFAVNSERAAIWGTGPGKKVDQVVAIAVFFVFNLLVLGDNYFEERAGARNRVLSIAGTGGLESVRSRYVGNPGERERDSGMIPNAVPG